MSEVTVVHPEGVVIVTAQEIVDAVGEFVMSCIVNDDSMQDDEMFTKAQLRAFTNGLISAIGQAKRTERRALKNVS